MIMGESSGKLGPQAAGFLAVLAISGSVVLLTIGKHKLWQYVFPSNLSIPSDCSSVASDSVSLSASKPCSSPDCCRSGSDAAGAERIHDACSSSSSTELVAVARGLQDFRAFHAAAAAGKPFSLTRISSSACAADAQTLACSLRRVPVSTLPAEPDQKARAILKKVRFAPDVVEPAGDGREYRWKIKAARSLGSKKSSACKQEAIKPPGNLWDPALSSSNNKAGQTAVLKPGHERRVQTLAKPKLPANRMALYSGMQRYRLLMSV